MMRVIRRATRMLVACFAPYAELHAAEAGAKKDEVVNLPPVVVEESQPKVKVAGPPWREELMAPGAIWKLDDPKRTESFLFDTDNLVRTVFGTKGKQQEDGTIVAGFHPLRLKWRLEGEWLVFFDRDNRRIEELKFGHDGWIWLSATRRNGEVLRFRVTRPQTKSRK